jgi:hypothetical protein
LGFPGKSTEAFWDFLGRNRYGENVTGFSKCGTIEIGLRHRDEQALASLTIAADKILSLVLLDELTVDDRFVINPDTHTVPVLVIDSVLRFMIKGRVKRLSSQLFMPFNTD